MKPFIQLLILSTLAAMLCGCPYSSAYRLDDEPLQPIDETLLGSWAAYVKKPVTGREEPVKIIFTKKTEATYSIAITGYIDELKPYSVITADSIKGEAFLSTAENRTFLNMYIHSRNYIAEVKNENRKLSLLPLSESFTAKLVKSNAVLRSVVEFHYKTRLRPVYDEDFCLKNLVKVK